MNQIPELDQALAAWRPGYALPGAVYQGEAIFREEIRRIFLKSWLYVGHVSQVPERGDYFLFEMAGESVIIVRESAEVVNALLNVCRHRGSRICDAAIGHEARLTCRYHGWTYGLDGALKAAAHLPPGFDKARWGLKRIELRIFAGMIFVNFDPNPVSFDPIAKELAAPLAPYQLDRARVAHRQNYPISSNWKLAVENYCECYHCAPAHPEYSVGHGRAIGNDASAPLLAEVVGRAEQSGLTNIEVRKSWLDSGQLGTDRGFEKYPLLRGHKTGSKDGDPVAPLLGSIKAFDGGAIDLHLGPMTFGLAYCDHVVLYRFTPRGLRDTDCEITWLVNENAVEGRDYDRAKLTWLWDVTTIADKEIIERNQQGVDSRYYEPGPLSPMEHFTGRFLEWYVAAMWGGPALRRVSELNA